MPLPTSLHEVPFIKLLIPLILGIAVQTGSGLLPDSLYSFILIPILVIVLLVCNVVAKKWRFRWVYGAVLYGAIFICGLFLAADNGATSMLTGEESVDVLVKIADKPQPRVNSYRVEGEVVGLVDNGGVRPISEKILLYFSSSDSLVALLGYADVLAVRLKPQTFESPSNPYQFNFAKYMQRKRIYYSSFVVNGEWIKVDNRANYAVGLAKKVRDKLLLLFSESGLKADELAVVSALSVGYKDLLDDELRRTYSAAGATHILAVSGLHVGIVYGMLLIILSAIPWLNRKIKLVVSLLFLWFFAFITGLSPSVLRATAMFSMVEIGRSFGYRTNTFNTLAAVAFVLLVADPNNLYNLGFQLSFLAVLSIIVFSPFICNMLIFRNKVVSWVWDLMAVSIAAQIGTLPVILLNFGQFSNYFLLTNMLAIPMASIILYLAVLLVATSAIPVVSTIVGKLLGYSVSFLNLGLKWIEELPNSVSTGIYCSTIQAFILSLAILLLAYFLEKKRPIALQSTVLLLCVYFVMQYQRVYSKSIDELVVFNLPRKSVFCIKQAHQTTFFDFDTASVDILKSSSFYTSGYIDNAAISKTVVSVNLGRFKGEDVNVHGAFVRRKNGVAVVAIGDYRVALPYNDSLRYIRAKQPLNVDLLIVNRFVDESVLKSIKPKMAVFDASVWSNRFPLLAVSMISQGVDVHNLQDQGAYTVQLCR